MDGRWPTELDYDLYSDQAGADTVNIKRVTKMWALKGWYPEGGVAVVAGVKLDTPCTYTIMLTTPPEATDPIATIEQMKVGDHESITKTRAESNAGFTKIYKLYNWGH